MLGYYRQPEVTAATFTEDGYLRTGDRGALDEDGRLKITGRVKELFKTSKGKYVAPAPIENIINNDSRVELSLVGGSGQPKTHAVVQLAEDLIPKLSDNAIRDEISAAMDALIDTINNEVEEFERVGFIVLAKNRWTIEGGELTPTMKIRRPVIEDLYTAKLDEWYASGERVIWE